MCVPLVQYQRLDQNIKVDATKRPYTSDYMPPKKPCLTCHWNTPTNMLSLAALALCAIDALTDYCPSHDPCIIEEVRQWLWDLSCDAPIQGPINHEPIPETPASIL